MAKTEFENAPLDIFGLDGMFDQFDGSTMPELAVEPRPFVKPSDPGMNGLKPDFSKLANTSSPLVPSMQTPLPKITGTLPQNNKLQDYYTNLFQSVPTTEPKSHNIFTPKVNRPSKGATKSAPSINPAGGIDFTSSSGGTANVSYEDAIRFQNNEKVAPVAPTAEVSDSAKRRVGIQTIINSLRKGGMSDAEIQRQSGLTNEKAKGMTVDQVFSALSKVQYNRDKERAKDSKTRNYEKRLARRARYNEDGTPRNKAALAESIAQKLSEVGTDTITQKTYDEYLTSPERKKLKRYYEAESWNGATDEQRREAQRIVRRAIERDKQSNITSQKELQQKNIISQFTNRDEHTKQRWTNLSLKQDKLDQAIVAENHRYEAAMKNAKTSAERAAETRRHNREMEGLGRDNLTLRQDKFDIYSAAVMDKIEDSADRTKIEALRTEAALLQKNRKMNKTTRKQKLNELFNRIDEIASKNQGDQAHAPVGIAVPVVAPQNQSAGNSTGQSPQTAYEGGKPPPPGQRFNGTPFTQEEKIQANNAAKARGESRFWGGDHWYNVI